MGITANGEQNKLRFMIEELTKTTRAVVPDSHWAD